jgi:hypothetical protein
MAVGYFFDGAGSGRSHSSAAKSAFPQLTALVPQS